MSNKEDELSEPKYLRYLERLLGTLELCEIWVFFV